MAATGTANLTYQWLENGTAISGATSATYSIPSVVSTSGGDYSVTVSNAFGSVTSTAATLIPLSAQPVAQTVVAGQNATFSVSPAGTGPFSYRGDGCQLHDRQRLDGECGELFGGGER